MRLSRTVAEARKPGADRHSTLKGGFPRRHPVVVVALALGALGLLLSLLLGLQAIGGGQPAASAGRPALPQTEGPLVVYSEFGQTADTLWAADPNDPTNRAQIALVEHAWGFGIFPSLSPDGAHIAYTVLPAGGGQDGSDARAELWLLETATGERTRLAQDIDLLSTPVWSPDSASMVVRRSQWQDGAGGSASLLRIDLAGAATEVAAADAGLYPIDFSPDGAWLYYAVLSPSGTDLARAPTVGSETETLAHLSDGVARDWHLSPDGTRLAYLAQTPKGAETTFAAEVLHLATGTVQTPLAGAAVAQFGPAWERDGSLTIGRLDSDGPVRLSAGGTRLSEALPAPPPGGGFDVPLSWSPDGTYLAVRGFQDSSLADPGPSWVMVVSRDGARRQLSPLSDVVVAGWLEVSE
ncbi:MAG: hypothetical protein A2148_02905 [Chloroflexi bacterium RBG_16_68_14]|nr:MAG: hypothetical protein A2148_02905 [Chloroflexi bacterium RBG_16_68_14]